MCVMQCIFFNRIFISNLSLLSGEGISVSVYIIVALQQELLNSDPFYVEFVCFCGNTLTFQKHASQVNWTL